MSKSSISVAAGWFATSLILALATLALLACAAGALAEQPGTSRGATGAATVRDAVPGSSLLSRNGSITIKVGSFDETSDAVREAAAASGAQLMDSKTYVDGKGRKHGWLRLRVDADQFDTLRAELRRLGPLYSDSVDAEDQVPDYEALGRRSSVLATHQDRLLSVLNGDRRLRGSDILFIQDRLFRAGTDQQDLLQQQDDMRRRAGYSMLFVELFEPNSLPTTVAAPVSAARRFRTSVRLARGQFILAEDRAATAGAYAITYSPVWGSVAIVLLLLVSWIWRRRRAMALAFFDFIRACRIVLRREMG